MTTSLQRLIDSIETVFKGNRQAVELGLCTLLAGGHLLIEDVPGVGKTTLARAIATAVGGRFKHIQFTSDMLPTDITGTAILNPEQNDFVFKEGPIFANVILADEINRASPRTQSALLEAMSDGSVSSDGNTRSLPNPFMVIATQNAMEHHGTYPLPESQMDRFTMRISLGYAPPEVERRMYSQNQGRFADHEMSSAVSLDTVRDLQTAIDEMAVAPEVEDYILAIVQATRSAVEISIGCSPRGGIALHRCARARALLDGRHHVIPDDVKSVAIPVLAHRIVPGSRIAQTTLPEKTTIHLVTQLLQQIPVPV